MKVSILGTDYNVEVKKYDEDQIFKKLSYVAYCSGLTKRIVLCDMRTNPDWKDEPDEVIRQHRKITLRHEIVHAFFNESGLIDSSNSYGDAWTQNEEMVDWIALQGVKLYKAWQDAGAI